MLYNKYGSVSPKKRFILLCLPLAAAIICTACNNAYAVNISDGGISYDNTYSQTESTSADTDKTTSQTKEEEPLPVPEPEPEPKPDYTITDAMYKYFDQFALVGDSVCSGMQALKFCDIDAVLRLCEKFFKGNASGLDIKAVGTY